MRSLALLLGLAPLVMGCDWLSDPPPRPAASTAAPAPSASAPPRVAPQDSVLRPLGCGRKPSPDLCPRLAKELGLPPEAARATYALRPSSDEWHHVCEVPSGVSRDALNQAMTRARGAPTGWGGGWSVPLETQCPGARLQVFGHEGRPLAYRVTIPSPAGSYCGTSKPRLAMCGTWAPVGAVDAAAAVKELRLFSAGNEGRFELDDDRGTLSGAAHLGERNLVLHLPSGKKRCGRLEGRLLLGEELPKGTSDATCLEASECPGCEVLTRR